MTNDFSMLSTLLQLAKDVDNTLAIDLYEAFKNESEAFDEGYEAGWNDAIMKMCIQLEKLEK